MKKLISLLMALLMSLSMLVACDNTPTPATNPSESVVVTDPTGETVVDATNDPAVETTAPVTEDTTAPTTDETTVPLVGAEAVEKMLAAGWTEENIEIVVTHVPDYGMLETVAEVSDFEFDLVMSDGIVFRVVYFEEFISQIFIYTGNDPVASDYLYDAATETNA